jgi:phosphomannomutase
MSQPAVSRTFKMRLVLRFEGHTPEAVHRIEVDVLKLLRPVNPDAVFAEAAH